MTPDMITGLATAAAVLLVAVLTFIMDRKDQKKAAEREIKTIPDNPIAVDRFRKWVQNRKTETDSKL
jgi:hypothetical protein